METNAKIQKILKKLKFDFAAFTMDRFLQDVSAVKSREMITAEFLNKRTVANRSGG